MNQGVLTNLWVPQRKRKVFMKAYLQYKNRFSKEFLKQYYIENIQYRCKPGIDRINFKVFNLRLDNECELILRKVDNNTYNFTAYKEILMLKGRDKHPRIISIPSIRDRITLGIVKDILFSCFKEDIDTDFVKKKIDDVASAVRKNIYTGYLKIDIEKFYDSIDHEFLIKKVKKKIRKRQLINLICEALKTPTISDFENTSKAEQNKKGVPQGLPISNILASIYLSDFDREYLCKTNILLCKVC